jgi:hypothetical protein
MEKRVLLVSLVLIALFSSFVYGPLPSPPPLPMDLNQAPEQNNIQQDSNTQNNPDDNPVNPPLSSQNAPPMEIIPPHQQDFNTQNQVPNNPIQPIDPVPAPPEDPIEDFPMEPKNPGSSIGNSAESTIDNSNLNVEQPLGQASEFTNEISKVYDLLYTFVILLVVVGILGGFGFVYYTHRKISGSEILPPKSDDPVKEYINKMKRLGFNEEVIRDKMEETGYSEEMLDNYFKEKTTKLGENPLQRYINDMSKKGYSDKQIRKQLTKSGYSAVEIHDSFDSIT